MQKIREIYNQIVELDKAEEFKSVRHRRLMVMCAGMGFLIILCALFAIYPLVNGYYGTFFTYIGLIFFLSLSLVALYSTNSTGSAATIAGYGSFAVLAITFYFKPYPIRGGLDGFWLWLLLTPFLADYFGGLITGFQISLGGFFFSVLDMWVFREHFQDYGGDVLTFYPLIYFIFALVAWILQFEIVYNHNKELQAEEAEKLRQEERLRNMEKELHVYEESMSLVKRHHHDLRHYTRVLRQILSEGDIEGAIKYLNELDDNLDNITAMTYCDNRLINGILSIYHSRLRKIGCNMKIRAGVPEKLLITEVDLTALLSNILENASEAQEKVAESERFLDVKLDYSDGKLKGQVLNRCPSGVGFNGEGLPESTKKTKSGIGTRSVKEITEKYGGTVGFEESDGVFTTRFILAC